MFGLVATQDSTFIIGWCAKLLGAIIDVIYNLLGNLGIHNIGLSIILFTVVVYLLMSPLTYKQQKFSKMTAKMSPELDLIKKKYANKQQDQAAMLAMNEETKAVYEKYGVSASGSCIQLLIQMPILFALYRVIANIPAYVGQVKDIFLPLTDKILASEGATEIMMAMGAEVNVSQELDYTLQNTIVDVLYKFEPSHWTKLSEKFPELSEMITSTQSEIDAINHFVGLNIGNTPMNLFMDALKTGAVLVAVAAVLIPVLAAATQWLNIKLMPQSTSDDNSKNGGETSSMGESMKMMNNMMPLMSAVFCVSLPAGMGLYWIMSAVVRSIMQVILNKHFDSIDMDEMIKKNLEKINEKRAKKGLPPQKLNEAAIRKAQAAASNATPEKLAEQKKAREEAVRRSTEYYKQNAKPGSIASKANMVKQFDEKNGKK